MKLMKYCCQWGKGVAEEQVVSRLLAVAQRLEVSRGCLLAGRDEAVANGPQLWLHVLLDVPRGSFGVLAKMFRSVLRLVPETLR